MLFWTTRTCARARAHTHIYSGRTKGFKATCTPSRAHLSKRPRVRVSRPHCSIRTCTSRAPSKATNACILSAAGGRVAGSRPIQSRPGRRTGRLPFTYSSRSRTFPVGANTFSPRADSFTPTPTRSPRVATSRSTRQARQSFSRVPHRSSPQPGTAGDAGSSTWGQRCDGNGRGQGGGEEDLSCPSIQAEQ